ncbi:MAG: hypothetical protein PHO32_02460 [Candidatus Cloacimonetes bacterium]|nr:hypothetical protein [Candidatus Cloacimonadota bacterium]
MESIKELLIKKFAEITGNEPIEDEWEPRIRNMLSIVCQNRYKQEDIVTLTDTGIGNNGGAGIVLTTDAICVKDWGNSTKRFIARFRNIEYCLMEEDSFLGMDFTKLELHMKSGAVYKLSTTIIGMDLAQMQELIEYAMSLQDDGDEQSEPEESSDAEPFDEIQAIAEKLIGENPTEPVQKLVAQAMNGLKQILSR